MAETVDYSARGYVFQAVREGQDWFVYNQDAGRYIGKVLVRPHSTKGPFIAFMDRDEISDNHGDLDNALESIAERFALAQEGS
jgi:hypothetical protein